MQTVPIALGEPCEVKGQDMAARVAYSKSEGLPEMPIAGARMSPIRTAARLGGLPDQAIVDTFDLLHRLTDLVDAFGNISGPHPVTQCGARRS